MALPLIPILGGALGGALTTNALTKKGDTTNTTTSTSTTRNSSYTDSRQIDVTYPVYQVQIDSPMSSQTTKKEAAQKIEPSFSGSGGSAVAAPPTDLSALIPVALIIAGAVVIKEIL